MRKSMKKAVALFVTAACMLGTLTGCGSDKSIKQKYTVDEASKLEVMAIGEEVVTMDEAYLYVIQCMYTYGLDEETASKSEPTYKSTILEQLHSSKAKYQVALTADLEITEEDKAEVQVTADKYYEMFGEELLSAYGISKEAVYQLFLEQRYITKLQDKATNDLYNDAKKEAEDNYGDKTFVELYYVLFPTATVDAEGNAVPLSDEEIAEAKKNAEEVRKRALAGESLEDIGAEYKDIATADTQRTFLGAHTEDLNSVLESLDNGEISEIYEDTTGYMVMQMVNNNDTEYRDYFIGAYAKQKAEDTYASMEDVWLGYMDFTADDINTDLWSEVSIVDVARYMYNNGMSITKDSQQAE